MSDELTKKLNSPKDVLDAFCNLLSGLKVSTPSLNLTPLQCWHIGRNAVDQITHLQAQVEALEREKQVSAMEYLALEGQCREHLDKIEGMRKDADWQPIETAPKDDDTLILVANDDGVWVAKYRPVYQSGFKPSNPWSSMLLNHDHIRFHKSHTPTHWKPLPAAPVVTEPLFGELVDKHFPNGIYAAIKREQA
jgi:hypothetical protein